MINLDPNIRKADMNFRQLETFRWIARLNSFGRAAHKVNATQSTVSMRLAELEKELGIVLLDRTRRSVRVTPKGRDLLRYAEEVAHLVSEIRHFVGNADSISGTLRVGAAELVALTWLPQLVRAVRERYPLVDVELQVGLSGGILALLAAGELDLVFMPTDDHPALGMRIEPLGKVRFGFFASRELGIPASPLTPAALLKWPIITHGPESVVHAMLVRWFGQSGAQLGHIVTSNSMGAAAKLTAAGLGITFLPLFYYESWIAEGKMMRVRTRPAIAPIRFSAIVPQGRAMPLVEAVVQLAAQHSSFGK